MGYRIDYEPNLKRKYPLKRQKGNFIEITVAVFLLACIVILLCNPGVHGLLQEILLPGDPQKTAEAIENMIVNLKSGETFKNSVTAFCVEIIGDIQF